MALSEVLARLQNKFETEYASAKQANLKRYGEAKNIYEELGEEFKPGGAFDVGIEKQLDRSRTKAVAQGTQALVSSGLYSTTMQAGLGKKFEEEVGIPARERNEQYRVNQYVKSREGLAGVTERRVDEYPDYGQIAQLSMQAADRPSSSVGGGGYYVGKTRYASRPSKPTYTKPKTIGPSWLGFTR